MRREPRDGAVLEGEKVTLRPMREEDAEFVVGWRNNPEVRRWFFSQEPLTLESHLAWFRRGKPDRIDYVICLRESGSPIGTVSFISIDRREGSAQDGTMIGEPALWGKGFAREALLLWLAFGFGRVGLRRIDAHVKALNARIIRLLGGIGFSTLRTERGADGEEFHVMALMRDEAVRRGIVAEGRRGGSDGN